LIALLCGIRRQRRGTDPAGNLHVRDGKARIMRQRINTILLLGRRACSSSLYVGTLFAAGAIGCAGSSGGNENPALGGKGGNASGGTAGAAGTVAAAGGTGVNAGGSTSMPGTSGGANGSGGGSVLGGSGGAAASGGVPGAGGSGVSGASGAGASGGPGAGGAAMGGTAGAGGSGGGASGSAGAGGMTASKKFVGNITTNNAVRDGFVKYWDQITPENEGKWGSVQPSQGTFNWSALDKIYAYAKTNNVVFKQHNFVWGSQQPGWVNDGNAQTAVQAWMKAFCDRYPETKLIDVVNEPPPHTTPAYIGGMGGTGASGFDWIVNAFKWARAACPNAILILNDYNNIEYGNDNSHFIDIVTKIKAAGAPIDAIGAQAHDAYKLSTSTVKGFIDKLAATGLPVYITEYDIGVADDNMQKAIMQDQITMYYNHPNVKGITLWGYIVGSTWRANTGIQQPDGTMRPAMSWLMTFLGR
jgi:endo-1,4-beta-xylanase